VSLITREVAGGLVVAEHGMDAQAIQRALKQIDDRLILWPPDSVNAYWQVYSRVSDWYPPTPVAAWMDDYGNPLPLSSGLIDKVNRLRLDAPNKGLSVDDHNALRAERIERDREQRGQAVLEDHKAKVERGRTSVSFGPLTRLSEQPRRIRRRQD
jgi:hypothetical protein